MFILDFVDLYLFGCLVSICFGVLKCWLTGWVVLSGLIGAWFLYVIRWFNFPLGSPLGIHFWELWVVLLVVIFVYWHLAARVFFWQLWVPSSPF